MRDNFKKTSFSVGEYHVNIGFRNYLKDYIEAAGAQVIMRCGEIPNHIAFCMDGNRRFAKKRGLDEGGGHVAGFGSMMRILLACYRLGVKNVTVYAFSIENFNRSQEESEILFNLVRTKLWDMVKNRDSAMRQLGWQVKFPGNRKMLEADLIERMETIERITSHGGGMIVNVCAPYTSRDDLTTAVSISASAGNVSMESLENARYLARSGSVDIFVRTSGETRLSDFMAWEVDENCSFEFVPELWPELTVWKVYLLVAKWQRRRATEARPLASLSSLGPAPRLVSVSKRAVAAKR